MLVKKIVDKERLQFKRGEGKMFNPNCIYFGKYSLCSHKKMRWCGLRKPCVLSKGECSLQELHPKPILTRTREIAGKKILGNVWEIDRRKLTPELEKECKDAVRSYNRGLARRQEMRREKRYLAEKKFKDFLITY